MRGSKDHAVGQGDALGHTAEGVDDLGVEVEFAGFLVKVTSFYGGAALDDAGVGLLAAGQQVEQGRFAAAVAPDDADARTRMTVKSNLSKRTLVGPKVLRSPLISNIFVPSRWLANSISTFCSGPESSGRSFIGPLDAGIWIWWCGPWPSPQPFQFATPEIGSFLGGGLGLLS